MNIARYINRQFHNIAFRIVARGVLLKGKGYVRNIRCTNNGINNVMIIDAGASIDNCILFFKGNNNIIHISSGTHLKGSTFWFEDDNNSIMIGGGVSCEDNLMLAACESRKITIGDDCMFSNRIQIRTTDSHSIIDENGKRINYGADISIGNHVWIGAEAIILKGCVIPDNCMIGARSMVTSSLRADSNSMIVGSPAKVIKDNINWKRERI